jgi:hypothetical protein
MNNDMNAFELSDEQLEEVTGAGITISPQIGINTNIQLNVATAPTLGVAVGIGANTGLNLKGANLNLGNSGLLGNTNKLH